MRKKMEKLIQNYEVKVKKLSLKEKQFSLYETNALDAILLQMCADIIRLTDEYTPICFIGILRRGAPLADRLSELIQQHYFRPKIMRLDLKVKRYADDLSILFPDTRLDENKLIDSINLSGYQVFIVDDVLYRGHSALKVLSYLGSKHPISIHTVFLVDRLMHSLPIRADVVGLALQVSPNHVIECHIPPYEPFFQIQVLNPISKN
jgi:pyrimidine operon attenuation protein/uracil phosphoribosyltransferase